MKKTLFFGSILVSSLAFAAQNDTLISFSTNGPDKYMDGSQVLDGECYALVWTPAGAAFGGIAADGTAAEPSKLVLKAPVAKGGRCPRVLFEIDEDYAKANFPGGTWNVVLLDTRRFATDADGVVVNGEDGLPVVASWGAGSTVVNGYGPAGAAVVGTLGVASAADAVASGSASEVPAAGRNVRIRDAKVVDGNFYVTVEGTLSSVLYGVKAGKSPDKLKGDGRRRYGKTKGEMVIVRPVTDEGEFVAVEVAK